MSKFRTTSVCFGMALAALLCPSLRASTLVVGKAGTPCPNAAYDTITAAVNAAQSGDTIQICPALYPEQLTITKPLTLQGISQQGIGRVLIQPATFGHTVLPAPAGDLGFMAVISVVNTSNVSIVNLAIDASNNTAAGCAPGLAGIHFFNASGRVEDNAISGTALSNQTSCTALFPGNGAGVQADQNDTNAHQIVVLNNSIHDFGRNGVLVIGAGETAYISSNTIQAIGPSTGVNQFGVFLANGVTGEVTANIIAGGNCGSLPVPQCATLRSEGVVLRSAGNNLYIALNVISNAQFGIFINGAAAPLVNGNIVNNVDLTGIQVQASSSGTYTGNRVGHVLPLQNAGCGLASIAGTGASGNQFRFNLVNDSYCGIGFAAGDRVEANTFFNTLYETQDTTMPNGPPTEPGQ